MRPARWLPVAAALACGLAARAAEVQVTVQDLSGRPLAEAVVYAEPVSPGPLPPPGKAVIDQVNKQFVPRVSVIQTGTAVELPNSDNIRHSVYSFSPPKPFELKLYAGRPAKPVVFDKPGVVVLGCNIHDQMIAWVVVVDTPHFGHSGADGKVKLPNVPAGAYRLKVWHPSVGREPLVQDLEVTGSGATSRTVQIDAQELPAARH